LMQNQDEAGEKNSTKINMTRPPTERAVAEGLVENGGVNIAFPALRLRLGTHPGFASFYR
jgi:hypothetical protein